MVDGESIVSQYYLQSFYFMTTIMTTAGIGDLVPRSTVEMVIVTIQMILSKFIIAIFIGDISAIVQNYSYTLVNYDHAMGKLKVRLISNV